MAWPERSEWLVDDRRLLLRKFLLALMCLVYLSFFFPFWHGIVTGTIMACGCSPLIGWFRNKLNLRRNSSLAIFLVLISLFVSVVLFLFFTSIYSFIAELAKNNRQFLSIDLSEVLLRTQNKLLTAFNLQDVTIVKDAIDTLSRAIANVDTYITGFAQRLLQNVPNFILEMIIFFMVFFGITIYRGRLWSFLSELLGFRGDELALFAKFEMMCARTLISIFVIGAIQASIVVLGFYLSHTTNAYLFVFNIAFLFSLIPLLGAPIVPILIAIACFINGNFPGGIILLVTAGITMGIDNVLKGLLFSRAANSNPFASLTALLGSLALFGFVGLFLAPLFEQMVMSYLDYKRELNSRGPDGKTTTTTRIVLGI